jgi:hypothetical protein
MTRSSAKPRRAAVVVPAAPHHFEFRHDGVVGAAASAVSATPARTSVDVADGVLTVRFGPWTLSTPLTNIAEVSESGPYRPWKVAGPPRLSLADRGITFATNADRGVCVRFFNPVPGIEPTGRLRHPGMTVTVADPDGLLVALASEPRTA